MPDLSTQEIADLLLPYVVLPAPTELCGRLSIYLALLERWNRKLNLTAVRDPRQIVQRHFGESLFLEALLPPCTTLLDIGSGAGFPGMPIAFTRALTKVTLAESHGKKAAFLREVAETVGAKVEVWPQRAEALAADRKFECVTLRAVDEMQVALQEASSRVVRGGTLAFFAGERDISPLGSHWTEVAVHSVPGSMGKVMIARFVANDAEKPHKKKLFHVEH